MTVPAPRPVPEDEHRCHCPQCREAELRARAAEKARTVTARHWWLLLAAVMGVEAGCLAGVWWLGRQDPND